MPEADDNKAAVRRLYEEVINAGNLDRADQYFSRGMVEHGAMPGTEGLEGIEAFKRFFTMARAAFPKLDYKIKAQVAEGSSVVVLWEARGVHEGAFLGVAPSKNEVQLTGFEVLRFDGGKCVEHSLGDWGASELLRQVSADPPPSSAAVEAARIGVEAAKVRVEEAKANAEASRTGSVEAAKIQVERAKELVERAKVGVETKRAEAETAKVSLETRKVYLEERRLRIAEAQDKNLWRLLLQAVALLLAAGMAFFLAFVGRGLAAPGADTQALPNGWVVAIVALAAPLAFTVLVAAGAASFRGTPIGGTTTGAGAPPAGGAPTSGAAPASGGAPEGGGGTPPAGGSATTGVAPAAGGGGTSSAGGAASTVQASAVSPSREPALYTFLAVAAVDALLLFGVEGGTSDPLIDAIVVGLNAFAWPLVRSRVKPVEAKEYAEVTAQG